MLLLLLLVDCTAGGKVGSAGEWGLVAVCTGLACLLEAFTSQIDNLFLPLVYYASLLTASAYSAGRIHQ